MISNLPGQIHYKLSGIDNRAAARTATFAAHQLNWIDRLSVDVDLISTLLDK